MRKNIDKLLTIKNRIMKTKNERIEDFLKSLNIDNLYVMDYVNIDEIVVNCFQKIVSLIF